MPRTCGSTLHGAPAATKWRGATSRGGHQVAAAGRPPCLHRCAHPPAWRPRLHRPAASPALPPSPFAPARHAAKTTVYRLHVSADGDNTPLRLHMQGNDLLSGSHFDEYIVDYRQAPPAPPPLLPPAQFGCCCGPGPAPRGTCGLGRRPAETLWRNSGPTTLSAELGHLVHMCAVPATCMPVEAASSLHLLRPRLPLPLVCCCNHPPAPRPAQAGQGMESCRLPADGAPRSALLCCAQ